MLRAQSAADRDTLYQAAKVDLQAGHAAVALGKLQRGLAAGIDDHELRWTYRLAIAVARDALGQPLGVLEGMQRLEQDLHGERAHMPSEWRTRLAGMYQRVATLEPLVLTTHGALHITSEPAGARVFVDGTAAGMDGGVLTPFTVYLSPGPRRVRLELKDHDDYATTVRVQLGEIASVDVALEQSAPPIVAPDQALQEGESMAAPTTSEVEPLEARSDWLDPTWGWIMAGSGAAVLLAGIPFTVMAYDDYQSMQQLEGAAGSPDNVAAYRSANNSKKRNETLAGVCYGMGATIAVGGAAWLIFAYTWESATDDSVAGLVPIPGGAVMTFGRRF